MVSQGGKESAVMVPTAVPGHASTVPMMSPPVEPPPPAPVTLPVPVELPPLVPGAPDDPAPPPPGVTMPPPAPVAGEPPRFGGVQVLPASGVPITGSVDASDAQARTVNGAAARTRA